MSEVHAQGTVFAFLAFVPVDVGINGGVERFEQCVEPVVAEVDLRVTCVPRGIPAGEVTEIREGVTVPGEPAPGDQYVPTGLQFIRVVGDVAAVKGGRRPRPTPVRSAGKGLPQGWPSGSGILSAGPLPDPDPL